MSAILVVSFIPVYQYKCEILQVKDGDTLKIRIDLGFETYRDERLRLLGVDAPERFTNAGILVRDWVRTWVTRQDEFALGFGVVFPYVVTSHKTKNRDKYGRYLAEIMGPNGEFLHKELLATGLVVAATY